MLTGAGKTFTWDVENRLASVAQGSSTSFLYDYTGMRVEKNALTGISIYPYQGYEVDPNSVITKFIRIGIETFASKRGIAKYFYHNDHLGGVNVITDINGTRVQLVEYGPWGGISRQEGNVDPTHRFTGKELDPESGLYYYGGRYYDPVLSRFTSPDPFVPDPSDPQSLNRYSYVINNPANLVDPDGFFFEWIAAIVTAIAEAASAVAPAVAPAAAGAAVVGAVEPFSIGVGPALGILATAGSMVQAAQLLDPSSRNTGAWSRTNQPPGSPGKESSGTLLTGSGSGACEVCPQTGLEFLQALTMARQAAYYMELRKYARQIPPGVPSAEDETIQTPTVDVLDFIPFAAGVSKILQIINRAPINISLKGLVHTFMRHTVGGAQTAGVGFHIKLTISC